MRRAAVVALGLVLVGSADGAPRARDLHAFWDDRCADCHGHAAAFARRFLRVEGGDLAGHHAGEAMRRFLLGHGVPAEDVEPLQAMLLAQAAAEPAWEQRCRRCHGPAADFVRAALRQDGGALVGAASGEPVATFLPGHARLSDADATAFTALLERIAGEIGAR